MVWKPAFLDDPAGVAQSTASVQNETERSGFDHLVEPKRVLIVYPISIDFPGNSGVLKKMEQQAAGFRGLGLETTVVVNSVQGVIINGKRVQSYWLKKRPWSIANHYAFFWNVVREHTDENFDLVYVRYPGSSPMLLKFLNGIRREIPKAKVVLEVATYPFRSEMTNLKQRLIML